MMVGLISSLPPGRCDWVGVWSISRMGTRTSAWLRQVRTPFASRRWARA